MGEHMSENMNKWRERNGGIACVKGFRSAGAVGGIKDSGKPDVAVIIGDKPLVSAACFTQNQAAAASIHYCREILARDVHRGVVINSGNANCCTGDAGMKDTLAMASQVASELGMIREDFFVSSTGVVGVPLPMTAVNTGISRACEVISAQIYIDQDSFLNGEVEVEYSAADAILTTDLVAKEIAFTHDAGYQLAGICKGSGMIHPNMATMLAYVLTDALIDKEHLQDITSRAVARSFNSISVDNDESTNDTSLVFASGASGIRIESAAALADFEDMLTHCMQQLAHKIVRDGEGATHFVEVKVCGAATEGDANTIAAAICDSMLVKTAIAGNDPNWGRIVVAAGYAGANFELNKVRILLNNILIFSEGSAHDDEIRPFISVSGDVGDDGDNTIVKRSVLEESMHAEDIFIVFDLASESCSATRWTSDLTHGYISINADYTT